MAKLPEIIARSHLLYPQVQTLFDLKDRLIVGQFINGFCGEDKI